MAAAASDVPINELAVTYHMASPGEGYSRCAKLSTPAYIWAKRSNNDPVTDVKVVFDNDDPGPGFTKIADSLTNTSEKKTFLCYRKGSNSSPLLDIRIITEREPVEDGFLKIEGDLLRDNAYPKAFLYVKTKASTFLSLFLFVQSQTTKRTSRLTLDIGRQQTGASKGKEYAIGDTIDCQDSVNRWCVARILDVNDDSVYITYVGWSDKWNEWLKKKSPRIAP